MSDLTAASAAAFGLLAGLDADLYGIVGPSLQVSLVAAALAAPADDSLFLHHGRLLEHVDTERFFEHAATPEGQAFVKGELLW